MSSGSHGRRSSGKRNAPGEPTVESEGHMESDQQAITTSTPLAKRTKRIPSNQPSPFESRRTPAPVYRAPDAPFYPDAIEMWVVSDRDGIKRLVSEIVPGARHWRIGDPNVDFCVICKEGGNLLGCHTCKRSYHRLCLSPPPAQHIDHENFHCHTCTARGWHINPPADILPFQNLSEIHSELGLVHQGISATSPPSGSLQQLSSLHHDRTQAFIQGRIAPSRNFAKSTTVPGEASAASHDKGSQKPRKRRSRYQTVSDEVDAAMSTIYRELESASELRTEITRMQDKMAKLEQERQIQEGKVALVREDLHAQTNAEIAWLKDEVTKLRNAHAVLSTENEQLRAQVQEAKVESNSKLKEMDDMKTKLREWLSK